LSKNIVISKIICYYETIEFNKKTFIKERKNQMKKNAIKFVDKLVSKTLKLNVNSTSSVIVFQPKMPKGLEQLSNHKK